MAGSLAAVGAVYYLSLIHISEHSQREGISMNQYCVYLLAKNDALHAG